MVDNAYVQSPQKKNTLADVMEEQEALRGKILGVGAGVDDILRQLGMVTETEQTQNAAPVAILSVFDGMSDRFHDMYVTLDETQSKLRNILDILGGKQ